MSNPSSPYFDARSTFTSDPKLYTVAGFEDAEAFSKVACDYHLLYEPVGPVEIHLVDNLVTCEQEKRRLTVARVQILQDKFNNAGEELRFGKAYADDLSGPRLLPRLAREFAALERLWFQSLQVLDRVQLQRRRREAQEAQAKAAQAKAAAEAAAAAAAAKALAEAAAAEAVAEAAAPAQAAQAAKAANPAPLDPAVAASQPKDAHPRTCADATTSPGK